MSGRGSAKMRHLWPFVCFGEGRGNTRGAELSHQDRIITSLRTIESQRKAYMTPSELVVQVPIKGMPWAPPLLTTRHPTPGLRLRDPTDLSVGFVNDSD